MLKDESLRENLRKEGVKRAKLFTWDETANKVRQSFMRPKKR
jgi:hypothetical protein